MMNCAVHQILKIVLKITLLISLCAIYFTVATLQGFHLDIFNRDRYFSILLFAIFVYFCIY